jgi:short-subunit dehydrogenase
MPASDAPWASALVTGASSGIGDAIARDLARRGVGRLVLVARRTDRLEALGQELRGAHGTEFETLTADLSDPEAVATVEARVTDGDRPIELVVNNAGYGTTGAFASLPVDGELDEIAVNVVALVRLTHAALSSMQARGHGAVLNVASIAAYAPTPNNATYSASKAFVASFSEALAEEMRGTGVTVTVVCPGFTRTDFQSTADYHGMDRAPGFVWLSADAVAEAAVAAAAAGRALCVPGVAYKMVAGVTTPMPRTARRWFMGQATRATERFSS